MGPRCILERQRLNTSDHGAAPRRAPAAPALQSPAPTAWTGAAPALAEGYLMPLASPLYPKLEVGDANDPAERAADAFADRVMGGGGAAMGVVGAASGGVLRRKCSACEEEDGKLHRKETAGGGGGGLAPPVVHRALSGPSHSLDAGARGAIEGRGGVDLSGVRVHTDALAAESARAVGARAYTVGSDLVFGAGEYRPGTSEGLRLIAHEVGHLGSGVVRLKPNPDQAAPQDEYLLEGWAPTAITGGLTSFLKGWLRYEDNNKVNYSVALATSWAVRRDPDNIKNDIFDDQGHFKNEAKSRRIARVPSKVIRRSSAELSTPSQHFPTATAELLQQWTQGKFQTPLTPADGLRDSDGVTHVCLDSDPLAKTVCETNKRKQIALREHPTPGLDPCALKHFAPGLVPPECFTKKALPGPDLTGGSSREPRPLQRRQRYPLIMKLIEEAKAGRSFGTTDSSLDGEIFTLVGAFNELQSRSSTQINIEKQYRDKIGWVKKGTRLTRLQKGQLIEKLDVTESIKAELADSVLDAEPPPLERWHNIMTEIERARALAQQGADPLQLGSALDKLDLIDEHYRSHLSDWSKYRGEINKVERGVVEIGKQIVVLVVVAVSCAVAGCAAAPLYYAIPIEMAATFGATAAVEAADQKYNKGSVDVDSVIKSATLASVMSGVGSGVGRYAGTQLKVMASGQGRMLAGGLLEFAGKRLGDCVSGGLEKAIEGKEDEIVRNCAKNAMLGALVDGGAVAAKNAKAAITRLGSRKHADMRINNMAGEGHTTAAPNRDGAAAGSAPSKSTGAGAGETYPLRDVLSPQSEIPNKGGGKLITYESSGNASADAKAFHGENIWSILSKKTNNNTLDQLGFKRTMRGEVTVPNAEALNANLERIVKDSSTKGRLNDGLRFVEVDGKGASVPPAEYLKHIAQGKVPIDKSDLLVHDLSHGVGLLSMPPEAFNALANRSTALVEVQKRLRSAGMSSTKSPSAKKLNGIIDDAIKAEVDRIDGESMSLTNGLGQESGRAKVRDAMEKLTSGTDDLYNSLIERLRGDRDLNWAVTIVKNMQFGSKSHRGGSAPSKMDVDKWTRHAMEAYTKPGASRGR